MREQNLLTTVLTELRKLLPFDCWGFDTDNDSVFMNETVRDYCAAEGIAFTRCRPYRKNDQAWGSRRTAPWSKSAGRLCPTTRFRQIGNTIRRNIPQNPPRRLTDESSSEYWYLVSTY